MRQHRTPLYLFGILLLLAACTMSASAAIASRAEVTFYGGADSATPGAFGLPAPDHQWHVPADTGWMKSVAQSPDIYSTRLVSFATEVGTMPSSESDDTDIRHRGFRKFLVMALVAGALIRLLTSATYRRFITDALDPKSF